MTETEKEILALFPELIQDQDKLKFASTWWDTAIAHYKKSLASKAGSAGRGASKIRPWTPERMQAMREKKKKK